MSIPLTRCPRIDGCRLYPCFSTKSALETFRALYCEGDFEHCQRYVLSNAGAAVSDTLLPNGKELNSFKPPRTAGG